MNNKKFGCGCLGNGTTVWDRTVIKSGDYKKIAHIDEQNNVRWYPKRITQEMKDYVNSVLN